MKNTIINLISLIIIMIICIIVLLPIKPSIAVSTDLITVGTGKYQITVTNDSTVDDIIKVLGEPKLKTKSVFGGYAYTFYTDENYSNYLYIETTSNGKIISFGSVDPSYTTSTYSYGDAYNYRENGALHGTLFNDNSVIKGGVYYNKNVAKNTSTVINNFKTAYASDEINYLKSIVQHGILMYNAYSTNLGNKTSLTFDEKYFCINEQLKENGSSIRNYLSSMDKSAKMKAIGIRENVELSNSIYYLMNPGLFANLAKDNKTSTFGKKNIAIFDYNSSTKLLSAITISSTSLDKMKELEYTSDEKNKLSAGRTEYKNAITNLYKETGLYDIEPISKDVENLRAGKLKQSKLDGINYYLNAIKVAGGLPKLTISEDATEVAQHISTLISYRYTELNLPIAHVPDKPEGLSDEYYKIALGNGKGYAENLGRSTTNSTESTMMYYMNLFLDDSGENPQNYSHRQKITNPEYTYWGFGISPYTFSNEFGGYKATDIYLGPWPSKGITFLESLVSKRFCWSAQFFDKYKITDTTTAKIECLNTGETWEFNEEESSSTRKFKRNINTIQSLNNRVLMYDYSIVPEQGAIYQVTLYNIKNSSTGNLEEYSYRTVFEYADPDSTPTRIQNISIEVPDAITKVSGKNYYGIPDSKETKLIAKIDENAEDKLIKWTSSDSSIVDVTQNGTLIVKKASTTPVTITACSDYNNDVKATIQVIPLERKIVLDKTTATINKGESQTLTITEGYESGSTVKWKVKSMSNSSIEYDITDSNITKYINVETTDDDKTVRVTAVNAEENNSQYQVICYVDENYKATCDVKVNVPIESIRISPGIGTTIQSDGETSWIEIDYSDESARDIELRAVCYPSNTTETIQEKWTVGNSNIVQNNNDGTFKVLRGGETIITLQVGNYSAVVTVKVTNDTEHFLKGDVNQDGKVTIADVNLGLRKISKKIVTDEEHNNLDVTGDGKFTIADINKMLRYLSKKIIEL